MNLRSALHSNSTPPANPQPSLLVSVSSRMVAQLGIGEWSVSTRHISMGSMLDIKEELKMEHTDTSRIRRNSVLFRKRYSKIWIILLA